MESLMNSFQYRWKLVWRALGQFPNGILKEFLSKSTEIGLERILVEFLSKSMQIGLEISLPISPWNPWGIPSNYNGNWSGENPHGTPFKSNANWFGELLVNFSMESLSNSEFLSIPMVICLERVLMQNQWKWLWRALGQFHNGILKEFLSKSREIGLERILMEFLSKSMEIGLGSSWSISQ